jgi:arsenate reductase
MAEGFLKYHAADRYEVHSAGTDPKPAVHPFAIRAMEEIDIDISHQQPKPLGDFLGKTPVKHLLIVCDKANASCPLTIRRFLKAPTYRSSLNSAACAT